ncbi:MAG: ATP-binding cassette domain-containing protein, partial [Fimbriimonadales bacterium]|nr:ATP-binding cassette domain-containing protein [Fimbriimonadales bacterium]
VRDNIAFALERRNRLRPAEVDEVVKAKLSLVGLEGIEHLYPNELSGGMRKRVGLARALATDPDVLFLDEPTSGLDPVTAYAIDALIKDLTRQLNATIVLVTHDLNSVMRVARRVLFLHRGEVIFDGTPEEFHSSEDLRIREVVQKAEDESLSVS